MSTNGRSALLEQYGRFYGNEHFALAFTAGTAGIDAKRVVTAGWDKTLPLADGPHGAGMLKERGQARNVAIVLRPSNLIVLECDTDNDLIEIEELSLPTTLTVRSSEPYKRHFYFRPPEGLEALPYVAFRFESGRVTADSGRYFLAPPSLHPSGVQYSFLPGLGPEDTDIVELPEDIYRGLIERAREESSEQRERIAVDPEAKISAGQRRETLFRFACMLRRWGRPYDAILAECLQFNAERCDPPVAAELVEIQVKGAMKKEGDQELEGKAEPPSPIIFETLRSFLVRDVPQSESLVGVARDGTNLLPRYGWVMPWGKEGSGKTSILVDLLFHACAGIDWLGYSVGRSLKVVAVVNEGVPGGLQDKLRQKTERWEHSDDVLDNLAVYASPWGEFTFANERMVEHAKDFCQDFEADYIALDPLHTLGTTGVGSPVETEAFKHMLRTFGLWDWIGIITAHHSNKAGMLSGDWGRHPDTVIHVEKDGKAPATKYTLHKARPADPTELGVPCLLEWVIDTLGYTRKELSTPASFDEEAGLAKALEVLGKADGPLGKEKLTVAIGQTAAHARKAIEKWVQDGLIVDKTPDARSCKFVLPSSVESPATESDETGQGYEQTSMVEPDSSVGIHPTDGDVITSTPDGASSVVRRPLFREDDVGDGVERAHPDDIELDWS
jgi:hypothetical protein